MANINDLTDDLLLEILFRLPRKWACRCKAVSKRWSLLVSDIPYFLCRFIERHLPLFQPKQETSMPLVFLSQGDVATLHLPDIVKSTLQLASDFEKNLSLISFLGPGINPDSLEVVGCSNGLLLVRCRRYYSTREMYYVCNPVTQEWIQLPPPPESFKGHIHFFKGFICEPYFHFEPESETLTVNTHQRFRVLIGEEIAFFEFKADIFTSETGQWKSTVVYLPQCYRHFQLDFLFPTIAHGRKLYIKGNSNDSILVYDPFHEDNQFHVLPLPFHVDNQFHFHVDNQFQSNVCLGTCGGKLRFSRFYLYYNPVGLALFISVWELKEEEEPCWHLVHTASLQGLELGIAANVVRLPFSVRAFHPYDGDVVYLQHKCCVYVLNLRDNEVKKIEILEVKEELKGSFNSGFARLKILPIDFQWWPTPIPSLPR